MPTMHRALVTGAGVLDAMERIRAVVLQGVEDDVGSWRDVRRIVSDSL